MTAPDLLREAEIESKIALVLYVDGKQGDGKEPGRVWREAYVLGFLRALSPRSESARDADIERLILKERHAKHRSGTHPTPPTRRKGDAESAALEAEIDAEAERARESERDRRRRARPDAHDDSSEVKP